MIFSPAFRGAKNVTFSASNAVFSYISTQSAPGGMGAPVSILTQVPSVTGTWLTPPAAISSRMRSVTGASRPAARTSAARRA